MFCGWYVVSLTRPSEHSNSIMVAQPYVTKVFASQCSEWLAVSGHFRQYVEQMQSKGNKTWTQHGASTCEWLASSAKPAASSGQGRPALMDMTVEKDERDDLD